MKNLIILLKSLMINSQAEQPRETENPVKKSIKINNQSVFSLAFLKNGFPLSIKFPS